MRTINLARAYLLTVLVSLPLFGCGGPSGSSRFVFIPSPADSTVSVRICLLSGLNENPPALPSLAWSSAWALLGPSSETREQTINQLTSIGANVSFAVGFDVTVIEARCPASKWERCTQAVCDLICSDPSVGLKKDRLLAARRDWMAHFRQDASALAAAAFCGYPIQDSTDAQNEEVSSMLQSFWRTNYTRDNYVAGVTGPVTEAAARALDEQLQKRLPSGRPQRISPVSAPFDGLNVRVIGQVGATSVTFCLGRPADAAPSDTLTAVLALVTQQLSDPKQGRLNQVLRDDRGLIAGVDAGMRRALPRVSGEPEYEDFSPDNLISISTEVAPVNALHTLRIILKELTDLLDAGLSPEQLKGLRQAIRANFGNASNPQERLSRRLWENGRRVLERPSGESVIDALTPIQIRQYLRRVLDPQSLQIVAICPDASALASQILNGPVSYQYSAEIDQVAMHRDDQQYLSFRPFWQISKVHIEPGVIPPADSK
jgi:predicted Zn-dependent peptidase